MRCFLSTAETLLHVIARALANKRLLLIVMLSLCVPAESFAFKRVVDGSYIEFTGIHYFFWKQGGPASKCILRIGWKFADEGAPLQGCAALFLR